MHEWLGFLRHEGRRMIPGTEEHRQWSSVETNADLTARVGGGGTAVLSVAAAAGVVVPPMLPATLGLLAFAFGSLSFAAGRWVKDPPRRDYETRARVLPTAIREDVRVDDPLSQTIVVVAREVEHAAHAAEAGLRAYERWLYAVSVRDRVTASDRRGEAALFTTEVGHSLGAVAGGLDRLAVDLGPHFEGRGDVAQRAPRRGTVEDLGTEALAFLYLAGVPVKPLRRAIERDRLPWDPAILRDTARAFRETREFLASWSPAEPNAPQREP